jgi:superoxide dismutase, Fe-Mn family
MAFELPDLPYLYEDLEPVIDAETMRIHHDRHHAAYVANLNAALEGTEWADLPVGQLLARLDELPEAKRGAVRNNGGGHANHSLFWEIMSPEGGGHPEGDLAAAIDQTFGSVGDLKRLVNDAGAKRFGSGWAWLVHDGAGLVVTSTPNQDSPLMEALVPLLGIDVWEHAYYLQYQNRRPEYLEGWWNIVNWHAVGERYDSAAAAAG